MVSHRSEQVYVCALVHACACLVEDKLCGGGRSREQEFKSQGLAMLTVGSEAVGYEGSVRKSLVVCELALANGTESESEEKASPAEDRKHVGKLVNKPAGAASGSAGGDTHTGMTESPVEVLSAQPEDQNNALNACFQSVMQHLLMKGTAAMEAQFKLQDTENNGVQTIWSTCSLARSPI